MLYCFLDCELDDTLYQLRRDSKPVDIEPRVFDVLVYLIQYRDRLVTKDELLDKETMPRVRVDSETVVQWQKHSLGPSAPQAIV